MRKVTEYTVKAFLNGKSARMGNTRTDGESLWLHGNLIAKKLNSKTIELYDAGWQTVTTKERLNGVIELAGYGGRHKIGQHKFQWFWKGDSPKDGERWTGRGLIAWDSEKCS
jgi:N12 class adenine-specific DNA methylase